MMMSLTQILTGIAAGLISAVVFASAATGPVPMRVILFMLTPLALYLAGFNQGARTAAVAAGTGMLALLAVATPNAALVFGVSQALPPVILTHLAGLHRDTEDGVEWYPAGRLVIWTAAISGIFATLGLFLLGGDFEALSQSLRQGIERFVKSEISNLPGAPQLGPGDMDQLTSTVIHLLPGAIAISTMVTILLNLWLAGRITLASGRLTRPWPHLPSMTFPNGVALALAAALVASFAGGMIGLAAAGIAGGLICAFVCLGLAVIHYVTAGNPWRPFLLAFIYASLVVFGVFPAMIIAIIGLIETMSSFRKPVSHPPDRSG